MVRIGYSTRAIGPRNRPGLAPRSHKWKANFKVYELGTCVKSIPEIFLRYSPFLSPTEIYAGGLWKVFRPEHYCDL